MTQSLKGLLSSILLGAAWIGSFPNSARADGGAPSNTTSDAGDAMPLDGGAQEDLDAAPSVWSSCIEHVPAGASRARLTEEFPDRGLAGHAVRLRVRLEHGKGETVFPNGVQVQSGTETARVLAEAGFWVPSADGGTGPSVSTQVQGDRAVTEVNIPFVALPPKPGRTSATLPPMPIALARASGEILTLCTKPHRVTLEDPTSNAPDAMPKGNPPPRPQRELWTLARDVTYGVLAGAAAAAVITWLVLRWLRRPRPLPPPPPPRPAWEVAFEELESIRKSDLVLRGMYAEYFDRVSDITRRYLGARYGFDGIESTTNEVLQNLRAIRPPVPALQMITILLGDSDLVKFAKMSPDAGECDACCDRATQIVRETMPGAPLTSGPDLQPNTATTGRHS